MDGDKAPAQAPAQSAVRQRPTWLRALGRGAGYLALGLLPVVLLVGIAAGVIYVRLMNGPISLPFLKSTVESRFKSELGNMNVEIGDVIVSLAGRHVEFRLRQVRLLDDDGSLVAIVPLAAMEISRKAFFSGQISPSRIVLIEPRMRVFHTEAGGLALTIAGAAPKADTAVDQAAASVAGNASREVRAGSDGSDLARIEIGKMLANLAFKARRRTGAGNFLDQVGIRNAVVVLDSGPTRSQWLVPSGEFNLKHFDARTVFSGLMTVADRAGTVTLAMQAETSEQEQRMRVRTSVRNLQPATLSRLATGFDALKQTSLPVSGEAEFVLARDGQMLGGRVIAEIGKGRINFAGASEELVPEIDNARFAFRFGKDEPDIIVEPTTLRWSGSEMVIQGRLTPVGRSGWRYDLKAINGLLAAVPGASKRHRIERWSAKGHVSLEAAKIDVENAILSVGSGSAIVSGHIAFGASSNMNIRGRIGAMPVASLGLFWPSFLATDARDWVSKNVIAGQIRGGTFATLSGVPGTNGLPPDKAYRTSLSIEAADVQIVADPSIPTIFAPKVLLRLEDQEFEASVPEGALDLGNRSSMALKQVRFDVSDIYANEAAGRVSLRFQGGIRETAQLLSSEAFSFKAPGPLFEKVRKNASGKVEGVLNVLLPLVKEGGEPRVTGQMQLRDGRLADAFGSYDVSGAAIQVDLAERSVNAVGQVRLQGVPAKVAWQHIFAAPQEQQPPIRIDADLDEAQRKKLGFDVNHILRGELGVQLLLLPRKDGTYRSSLRADVTKAEIVVESLAWHKPAGRHAQLEFEITKGKRYPTVLENIRLVGTGIAIKGRAMLDARNTLREFDIDQFSIDLVTRLRLRGILKAGNIWRVGVKGETYEGRALFQSLFQAGRISKAKTADVAKQPGLDLEAEIDTVIGFWNSRMRKVKLTLAKRKGKIQSMSVEGQLAGGKLEAAVLIKNKRRQLHASAQDAGDAFRLVGFYPNAQGGQLELIVFLDGRGDADRTGTLLVRNFRVLGDQVVGEMASAGRSGLSKRRRRAQADANRQVIEFNWMRLPFLVGHGQFVMNNAELRGPLVGATIKGKANFETRRMNLSGTYVPLQGLNAALGAIPGLGQILAGPSGEGVLGMKFAVLGPMNEPEFLVNPLSFVTPGIFRELFQINNPSLRVEPNLKVAPRGRSGSRSRRGGWASDAFETNN